MKSLCRPGDWMWGFDCYDFGASSPFYVACELEAALKSQRDCILSNKTPI